MNFAYSRSVLAQIKSLLFQHKVLILHGARQVGKTTLCKALLSEHPGSRYFLCEQPVVMETLLSKNIARIESLVLFKTMPHPKPERIQARCGKTFVS